MTSTTDNSDKTELRPDILSTFLQIEIALRKYLMRFLVRNQDIEDVVQEAFLRSYNAEKKQQIQSPKSFIFKVAKNLALSEISRKSNQLTSHMEDFDEIEVLDGRADIEEIAIRDQQLQSYINALRALPPQCQRVFVMCKVYGFSHKEISAKLKISVSTVEKHLVKGLQRCHKHMQKEVDEQLADQNQTSI
jgi:RNA polymerase sigma factor (sigma-70 family)